MRRELELRRRLHGLSMLHEAISAMKSLAAHHLRDARAKLLLTREYRAAIDSIVERTGARIPAGAGARGLLVVGAELGLCGGYNTALVSAAVEHRAALGPGPTLCLGRRTALLLGRRGLSSDVVYVAPARGHGVSTTLLDVAADVLTHYREGDLSAFDVISNRFAGVGTYEPRVTRLLPVQSEPTAPRGSRAAYVDTATLSAVAARELLYATMHALLLDSLAAEHGARLVATQAAEAWLERRAKALRSRLTSARRESSTQEVIEIATGARGTLARSG
jgi:F-type H+-transporting ATPase subunit gamma